MLKNLIQMIPRYMNPVIGIQSNLYRNVFNVTPSISFTKYYSTEIKIDIVTYEDIKNLPKHPDKLLIDVREPDELKETGKIPTSINIPLGSVEQTLKQSPDKFKAMFLRDKPTENTPLIFSCKIGRRSEQAAVIAQTQGFKNVKNYKGSWTDWADKEGLPK